MTTTAPSPAVPRARRGHRPPLRDGRLLAGIALVLGSVVLGVRTVAAAGRTTPLLVLARDVPAGHVLAPDDVETRRAHLGAGISGYVRAGDRDRVLGRAATRALRAGELLPAPVLAAGADTATVPLDVGPGRATGVAPGELVDVWTTFATGDDKACVSVQVAAGLEVVATDDTAAGAEAVSVQAPPDLAGALVHASATSAVVLVRHDGPVTHPPAVTQLAGLTPAGGCDP